MVVGSGCRGWLDVVVGRSSCTELGVGDMPHSGESIVMFVFVLFAQCDSRVVSHRSREELHSGAVPLQGSEIRMIRLGLGRIARELWFIVVSLTEHQ